LAVSVNGPLDQPCATNTVDPATTTASGNDTNAARYVAHRTELRRNTEVNPGSVGAAAAATGDVASR
jgi:hypothetical protein